MSQSWHKLHFYKKKIKHCKMFFLCLYLWDSTVAPTSRRHFINKIILKLNLSKNVVLDWYSYKGQLISKADWGPIALISLKIEFFDHSKYNFKILLDKFQALWIWNKSAKCEYFQSDYKYCIDFVGLKSLLRFYPDFLKNLPKSSRYVVFMDFVRILTR